MTAAVAPATTMSCSYCQTHNHRACVGTVVDTPVAKFPLPCACGARHHDPDVETAARMYLAQGPFDAAARTVEANATAYRRKETS